MVFGYGQRRPEAKDYTEFVRKIQQRSQGLALQRVSLLLYGSFIRGDYIPGRSDIDSTLIFPQEGAINKEQLRDMGNIVAKTLREHPLPFEVTVTDIGTMRDGRFNSYNTTFEEYFKKEGRTIVGPEYRPEFRFSLSTHPEQEALRFNLRKSRTGLLLAEYDQRRNYESYLEKFEKTLKAVSRGSKQVLYMIDGELRMNRFSALEVLPTVFPDLDCSPLEEGKWLFNNLNELDRVYRNPRQVIVIWEKSVTFLEQLIWAYIQKVPNPT